MRSFYKKIFIFLLILFPALVYPQKNATWEHFSTDNGLTENTVLSMFQDKQGFMWFGTFSGLNRFDGYKFKTYKALSANKNGLLNDRIENIYEDKFGFIWVCNNDGIMYRLDKRSDKFQPIPQSIKEFKNFNGSIKYIINTSMGNLWLISTNAGCFKVNIDPHDYSVSCKYYSAKNGLLPSDSVSYIYEDSLKTTWVLTRGGLTFIKNNGSVKSMFNNGSDHLAFFNIIDKGNEFLMIASGGKVIRYNKHKNKFSTIQLPTTSILRDIIPMRNNKCLILTSTDGFFIYDLIDNESQHYNKDNSPQLKSTGKLNGYVDRSDEIWLTSEIEGILHFDPKTQKFRTLTLNTDKVGSYVVRSRPQIFEDIYDNLWIYPKVGGFSFYNRKTKELEYFHNSPNDPNRWFSNVLYSSYTDKQGDLWLSTFSQGIEKITFYPSTFELFKPIPSSLGVTNNEVRALCEDNSGNLWVAMRSGLLLLFDKDRKLKGYLGENGKLNESEKFHGLVYSINVDSKNNIWLGTKGNGLFKLKQKTGSNNYEISNYINNKTDKYSISSDAIYAIHEDGTGRIWIGTFGGGLNYIKEVAGKIQFINGLNELKNYPVKSNLRIRSIQSHRDTLWIGSTNGILSCNLKFPDPKKLQFTSYVRNNDHPQSLSHNDICKIIVTRKGKILFGTIGGGINILDKATSFISYNSTNNFPVDVALGMVEDNNGKIWISSENKLIKFDLDNKQTEVYGKNYGIVNTNFSESVSLLQKNGKVVFGSSKGLYMFDPSDIHQNTYKPPIVFTGFMLFNNEILPLDKDSPLDDDINVCKSLTLNHNQSVFTIEFSALDFRSPENILYAYKLEHGDKSEYIIQKQRSVTFTNLQPGNYFFKVKSTNSEGAWISNERQIIITVLPPPWRSNWAYAIYFILTLLLLIFISYIFFIIFKLKNRVKIEKEITDSKVQFFTEISHELRTPLTLISLPVERILKEATLPTPLSSQLNLVKRNIDRMVRLVNQILEFRKIQEIGIKLRIEEVVLENFANTICEYYADIAEQKSIKIKQINESNEKTVFIDKDKVEKIIYNLLSNAIKYSPENSSIEIRTYIEGERIYISVKDEGPGISSKMKGKIFKLFESGGNDNTLQTGTGIGLAFSKKLAEAHKATIDFESSNKGTCMKVGFLMGKNHFDANTLKNLTDIEEDTMPIQEFPFQNNDQKSETTILIVEDNFELRDYLVKSLQTKYNVIEACDGLEGIQKALDQIPDIIISDIMMPKADGFELTQKLKSDQQTSHIPIILLTAKTTIDDKLTGLEYGADDYITKPFNAQYLEARIENILSQRQRLQEFYRSSIAKWEITPLKPDYISPDKQFMDKLMMFMEENFTNPELSLDHLESYLCLSTSSLYRKLKSLTNLSPNEFIREFRLIKSAHIIESTDFTINQISEMTGFTDYRYFTRCFKQHFNITPSQYRASKQKSNV